MRKWLSFIVPVYNAEKYLAECINSLLDQDFPLDEYEILLMNDGSTDNSLSIAENYAKQYKNIRVFTHVNMGVSYTRNEGLKKAEGEYIWFIDNDDRVATNILPVLFKQTQELQPDMLVFNYVRFIGTNYWRYKAFDAKESSLKTGIELFQDFYFEPAMWNKLLSRTFLLENNLNFVIKGLCEDVELSTRCFYHAKKAKSLALDALFYRIVENSPSHSEASRVPMVEGQLKCYKANYDYMKKHPCTKFWMRVFVLDLRRFHATLDKLVCPDAEKKVFIKKEKKLTQKVIRHLPIVFSRDYAILLLCATLPIVVLKSQRFLRTLKSKFMEKQ